MDCFSWYSWHLLEKTARFCCCKWLWRYSRLSRECGDAGSIPSCFKCQNIFEQISVRPWSEKSKSGKLSEKSISTNRNSQLITTSTNFWKRCTRVGHKRGDQSTTVQSRERQNKWRRINMFWYQSIIFHHKLMESMWSLCCCGSCLLDKSDSWGTGFIQIGTSNSWPAVDDHKTLIHWINKPTSTTRCAWVLVLFFFSTGCVRLQVFFRGQGKSLTHSHQLTTDSFCKFQASCTTQCIIQTFFKHVSDLSGSC